MQQYVTASIFSATLIVSAMVAASEPVPQVTSQYVPLYGPQQSQVYYYQQPAPQSQPYYAQPQSQSQQQSVFGRMMELERRKNQAILRFFGLR